MFTNRNDAPTAQAALDSLGLDEGQWKALSEGEKAGLVLVLKNHHLRLDQRVRRCVLVYLFPAIAFSGLVGWVLSKSVATAELQGFQTGYSQVLPDATEQLVATARASGISAGKAESALRRAEKAEGSAETAYSRAQTLRNQTESFLAELKGKSEVLDALDRAGEKLDGFAKDLAVNPQFLSAMEQALTLEIPVGTIVAYHGDLKRLKGTWLPCDGEEFVELSGATTAEIAQRQERYAELAAALGRTQTPNLQGMFLRGLDTGGADHGGDPDRENRVLGGFQDWMLVDHAHAFSVHGKAVANGVTRGNHADKEAKRVPTDGVVAVGDSNLLHDDLALNPNNRGVEVRPKNVAVHWIIKAM